MSSPFCGTSTDMSASVPVKLDFDDESAEVDEEVA
jgi:hypothetical protein